MQKGSIKSGIIRENWGRFWNLPKLDLLATQKESYKWFSDVAIAEIIKEISPIEDFTEKSWSLALDSVRFGKPSTTPDNALVKGITFDSPLYVKATLTNKKTGKTQAQEVFLGDIPQMTERGTFIINGIERAVVNQLVRSPGVFFTAVEDRVTGKTLYSAEIRPIHGSWLEFITTRHGTITVKIDRRRKFLVTTFLRALGISSSEDIQEKFKAIDAQDKESFIKNTLEKDEMRIVADHFTAASFITFNNVTPSNKEQGYVLRRLIRRGLDGFYQLGGTDITLTLEAVAEQYKDTDPEIKSSFEKIKLTLLQEEQTYKKALGNAKQFIQKKYRAEKQGDELKGIVKISSDDAFILYSTHGLSPTQIKSLGYEFSEQEFAEKMKQHQNVSRKGAEHKFHGGLADHSEQTVMGHTATHLLHQALRDVLGNQVHQTGSNITSERLRFDFNYDQKLTDEQIAKVEQIINDKIQENLPVHFEMMSVADAKKLGAIGLFEEKYQEKVKVYFIGDYSKEFCGGPHVDFTSKLKRVKIIKQENIGNKQRRLYAKVS